MRMNRATVRWFGRTLRGKARSQVFSTSPSVKRWTVEVVMFCV